MKAKKYVFAGLVAVAVILMVVSAYAEKEKIVSLPAAAKAVLSDLYPDATVEEAKLEKESLRVYEVELKQGDQEFEITVAPDGTIMEVTTELTLEGLPDVVRAAIITAAQGAEVKEVAQEVTHWIVTLKQLEVPEITYEAELIRDGQDIEIEIAPDGTVMEQNATQDDENSDDQDDDDGEETVSLDKVPDVVRATLIAELQTGEIKKIERDKENGRTIYEAEVIIDGREIEIKIADDGTLIDKEVEDEENEDD